MLLIKKIFSVFIVLFSCFLFLDTANSSNSNNSPEETLNNYIELDAKRIDKTDSDLKALQNLTILNVSKKSKPVSVIITSIYVDYEIINIKTDGDKASIDVKYKLIGKITDFADFRPFTYESTIKSKAIKKNGKWYVSDNGAPYYYWSSVLDKLRLIQKESENIIHEDTKKKEFTKKHLSGYITRSNRDIGDITYLANNAFKPLSVKMLNTDYIVKRLYYDRMIELEKQDSDVKSYIKSLCFKDKKVIKNAIFARLNYDFETKWIQKYFVDHFPKYRPKKKSVSLTEIDKKNIKYLAKIKNRKCDAGSKN